MGLEQAGGRPGTYLPSDPPWTSVGFAVTAVAALIFAWLNGLTLLYVLGTVTLVVALARLLRHRRALAISVGALTTIVSLGIPALVFTSTYAVPRNTTSWVVDADGKQPRAHLGPQGGVIIREDGQLNSYSADGELMWEREQGDFGIRYPYSSEVAAVGGPGDTLRLVAADGRDLAEVTQPAPSDEFGHLETSVVGVGRGVVAIESGDQIVGLDSTTGAQIWAITATPAPQEAYARAFSHENQPVNVQLTSGPLGSEQFVVVNQAGAREIRQVSDGSVLETVADPENTIALLDSHAVVVSHGESCRISVYSRLGLLHEGPVPCEANPSSASTVAWWVVLGERLYLAEWPRARTNTVTLMLDLATGTMHETRDSAIRITVNEPDMGRLPQQALAAQLLTPTTTIQIDGRTLTAHDPISRAQLWSRSFDTDVIEVQADSDLVVVFRPVSKLLGEDLFASGQRVQGFDVLDQRTGEVISQGRQSEQSSLDSHIYGQVVVIDQLALGREQRLLITLPD